LRGPRSARSIRPRPAITPGATTHAVAFKPDYNIHIERDPERGDVVCRGASRLGAFEERHPANTGAVTPWSIRTVD
jgi:hypothetical protein